MKSKNLVKPLLAFFILFFTSTAFSSVEKEVALKTVSLSIIYFCSILSVVVSIFIYFKRIRRFMKNYLFSFYAFVLCFIANNAFAAKSIEASAKSFNQKLSVVGLAIAPIGFILSAICYVFGSERGKDWSIKAFAGTCLIVGADALVQFIRSSIA